MTDNQTTLQQQIAALQAQLQAEQNPTPEIPQPEPVSVGGTDRPAEIPIPASNGPALTPELEAYIRQAIAQAALAVQPGPGAVATEPGSPAELAMAKALEAGALAHFDVTTRDGVVTRAFVYADGSTRLG